MVRTAQISVRQIIGSRECQEDRAAYCLVDNGRGALLVLADGMGGHSAGDLAADIATTKFLDTFLHSKVDFDSPYTLAHALDQANAAIRDRRAKSLDLAGMGCTLVAALISDQGLSWISIGDSILWLVRDGKITRLNQDHSMAPLLDEAARKGVLTPEQAQSNKDRNSLRSALTGDTFDLVDQPRVPISLRSKDLVLVASDGVMSLSEQELLAVVKKFEKTEPEILTEQILIEIEKKNLRRQDNASLIVFVVDADLGSDSARVRAQDYLKSRRKLTVFTAAVLASISLIFIFEPAISQFASRVQKYFQVKLKSREPIPIPGLEIPEPPIQGPDNPKTPSKSKKDRDGACDSLHSDNGDRKKSGQCGGGASNERVINPATK